MKKLLIGFLVFYGTGMSADSVKQELVDSCTEDNNTGCSKLVDDCNGKDFNYCNRLLDSCRNGNELHCYNLLKVRSWDIDSNVDKMDKYRIILANWAFYSNLSAGGPYHLRHKASFDALERFKNDSSISDGIGSTKRAITDCYNSFFNVFHPDDQKSCYYRKGRKIACSTKQDCPTQYYKCESSWCTY